MRHIVEQCNNVLHCVATSHTNSTACGLILSISELQRIAKNCNALLRSTTPCKTMQHIAKQYNTVQHSATQCNTVQNSATQCNTVSHKSPQCNTVQHAATHFAWRAMPRVRTSHVTCMNESHHMHERVMSHV